MEPSSLDRSPGKLVTSAGSFFSPTHHAPGDVMSPQNGAGRVDPARDYQDRHRRRNKKRLRTLRLNRNTDDRKAVARFYTRRTDGFDAEGWGRSAAP